MEVTNDIFLFYGMGTSVERIRSNGKSANLAEGYGIPSTVVDGMDVIAVKETTKEVVDKARKETDRIIDSYFFRSRSFVADPAKYGESSEVDGEKGST